MIWSPISLSKLNEEIHNSENELNNESLNIWKAIKIKPEKWEEKSFGTEGGGFWAVGIFGNKVIWYNDIEDGFNISEYSKYGAIDEYLCNQDELQHILYSISILLKTGNNPRINLGPPSGKSHFAQKFIKRDTQE